MYPMAIFDQVVGVNLNGTFNLTRLAAEQMSAQKTADGEDNGDTLTVHQLLDLMAILAVPPMLRRFPLARELSAYKIRVNAIAPGPFVTPMVTNLPQEAQDITVKDIPYPHRMGHPDEFAALVHHLLANQYINGEVIRLDGALRLSFNR